MEKYIATDCHLSFCILKLLVLCFCCLIKLCRYHYSCYDKVLLVEDDFKQQTKKILYKCFDNVCFNKDLTKTLTSQIMHVLKMIFWMICSLLSEKETEQFLKACWQQKTCSSRFNKGERLFNTLILSFVNTYIYIYIYIYVYVYICSYLVI